MLAALLPVAVTTLVGPVRLSTMAESAISKVTGLSARIEQGAEISFRPWLGFRAKGVRLSLPDLPGLPDAGREVLAAREVLVGVSLTQLALSSFSLESLTIDGLAAELTIGEDGSLRLGGLRLAAPEEGAPDFELTGLRGLSFRNSAVRVEDRRDGASWLFSEINASLGGGLSSKASVSMRIDAKPLGISSYVRLSGPLTLDETNGSAMAVLSTAVRADVREWLKALPDEAVDKTVLNRLSPGLNFGWLEGQGEVQIGFSPFRIDVHSARVSGLGARMSVESAQLVASKHTGRITATISAEAGGELETLLGLAAAPLEGGVPVLTAPSFPLTARIDAEVTPKLFELTEFRLADNSSQLLAQARIDREGDSPRLHFSLGASSLRLERYVAAAKRLAALTSPLWHSGETTNVQAAVSAVKPLDIDGRLEFSQLSYGHTRIHSLDARLVGRQGRFTLEPSLLDCSLGLLNLQGEADLDQAKASLSAIWQARPQGDAAPASASPEDSLRADVSAHLGEKGLEGSLTLSGNAEKALAALPDDETSVAKLFASLGHFKAKADVHVPLLESGLPQSVSVTSIEAKALGRSLSGQASYEFAAKPKIAFDLRMDSLDATALSRVIGSSAQAQTQNSGGLSGSLRQGLSVPAEVDGRLRLSKLVYAGLEADDLALNLDINRGNKRFAALTGQLFGGKINLSAEGDPNITNRMLLTLDASNVAAAKLAPLLGLDAATGQAQLKLTADVGLTADTLRLQKAQGEARLGASSLRLAKGSDDLPLSSAVSAWRYAAGEQGRAGELSMGLKWESVGTLRAGDINLKAAGSGEAPWGPKVLRNGKLEGLVTLQSPFSKSAKPVRLTMNGPFELDTDKGSFTLGETVVQAGIPVKIKAAYAKATGLTGSFDTGECEPRVFENHFGGSFTAKALPEVWRKARVEGIFSQSAGVSRIEARTVRLDDTQGKALLLFKEGASPRLELSLNDLDLDRYDPPVEDVAPENRKPKPLPLDTLKKANFSVVVDAGHFKNGGINYGNYHLEIDAKNGDLVMRQKSAPFYSGNFALEITGKVMPDGLAAAIDVKITQADVPLFLKEAADGHTVRQGVGELSINLKAFGATDAALRASASGRGSFWVYDGWLFVRDPGASDPEASGERLDFVKLGANVVAGKGLASTSDFIIQGPNIRARANGTLNLTTERLEMAMVADYEGTKDIPVALLGPIGDPSLKLDRSKIVNDRILRMFKNIFTFPTKALGRVRTLF